MKATYHKNYFIYKTKDKIKDKISNLQEGVFVDEDIYFDGRDFIVTCPECENEQADMGHAVSCENCGEGPMPTHEDLHWLEDDRN